MSKPPSGEPTQPAGASAFGKSDAKVPALPMQVVDRRAPAATTSTTTKLFKRGGLLHRLRWLPLIPVVMLAGGVIAMYFQPPGIRVAMRTLGLQPGGGATDPIAVPAPPRPAVNDTGAPAVRQVVALAKLVPQGEIRTVAPPFGAGDARIATLRVEEGATVKAGDIIALMDNEGQLKAALDAAKANVEARSAALQQVRAQVQASREEAQASLSRAEATARNAAADFERIEQLFKRGVSTEAALSKARTVREETAREVDRARATLSRFQSLELDRQPDVVVAASNLTVARSELARATQDLDKAYVRAPISGTVLTVLVRPGEKPGAAGIVKLGNLEQMMAEIEVFQTQIGFVALGDSVTFTADSLPKPLQAKITRIGLEVGRQSLVDATPAANTDARVVKVLATLSPEASTIAQRFTNLQMIARIRTRPQP